MSGSEIIQYITTNYVEIIEVTLTVIGAAAAIAALTPTPKDDDIIGKAQGIIKKIADFVGLNIGNAKNG